jgi:hypothetical protein
VRERKRERERRLEKHFRNLNVFLDFFTFGLRAIEKTTALRRARVLRFLKKIKL